MGRSRSQKRLSNPRMFFVNKNKKSNSTTSFTSDISQFMRRKRKLILTRWSAPHCTPLSQSVWCCCNLYLYCRSAYPVKIWNRVGYFFLSFLYFQMRYCTLLYSTGIRIWTYEGDTQFLWPIDLITLKWGYAGNTLLFWPTNLFTFAELETF